MSQNETPTEEDQAREAAAEKGIQELLSPEMGEALADAADEQFTLYAPMIGEENHNRLQQLFRVGVEFLVGAPTKLIAYWKDAIECLSDHPEEHRVWGSLAMLVFMPVLALLALPLGIGYFLRAFLVALYEGVIKRQITFIPKSEHRERLTRTE